MQSNTTRGKFLVHDLMKSLVGLVVAFFLVHTQLLACDLVGFLRDGKDLRPSPTAYVYAFQMDSSSPGVIHLLAAAETDGGAWKIAGLPDSGSLLVLCEQEDDPNSLWVAAISLRSGNIDLGTWYTSSVSEISSAIPPMIRDQLKGKDIASLVSELRSIHDRQEQGSTATQAAEAAHSFPTYAFQVTGCRCAGLFNGRTGIAEVDFVADVPGNYRAEIVGGGSGAPGFSMGVQTIYVGTPGPARVRIPIFPQLAFKQIGNTFFAGVVGPNGESSQVMCSMAN